MWGLTEHHHRWTIVYDSFGMNYCIWFLWDELLYMIPLGWTIVYDCFGMNYCIWLLWDELLYMIPLGWTIVYDFFGMNYCIWFLWDELLYMIPLGVSVESSFQHDMEYNYVSFLLKWCISSFFSCKNNFHSVFKPLRFTEVHILIYAMKRLECSKVQAFTLDFRMK